MFGRQDLPAQDNQIPEQSINNALTDDSQVTPVAGSSSSDWQHPGTPLDSSAPSPAPAAMTMPTFGTSSPMPAPAAPAMSAPDSSPSPMSSMPPMSNPQDNTAQVGDLSDLKQQALNQLSPLVEHLDQNPEEKFRTTMMMIQATDNQALVQGAYEAALQIEDEKARAQALLDVINEINYFTQHQK